MRQPRDVGEIIATSIKKLREARGLSQEALADRSGISQTMISAIERKATYAAADTLQALARALSVEVWQLQIEGIADDLLFTETLPDLVYGYSGLPSADREAIDKLIRRLARGPNRPPGA